MRRHRRPPPSLISDFLTKLRCMYSYILYEPAPRTDPNRSQVAATLPRNPTIQSTKCILINQPLDGRDPRGVHMLWSAAVGSGSVEQGSRPGSEAVRDSVGCVGTTTTAADLWYLCISEQRHLVASQLCLVTAVFGCLFIRHHRRLVSHIRRGRRCSSGVGLFFPS